MAFRFRKSARLGPLRFHFSKNGLSSISVGGRGASFNIPVNRSGGNRSTVGLPGTGLSWSVAHEAAAARGLPNRRRHSPQGRLGPELGLGHRNLKNMRPFVPPAQLPWSSDCVEEVSHRNSA